MPFIEPERRKKIDSGELELRDYTYEDVCYVHYTRLVQEWQAAPTWDTVHKLFVIAQFEKARGGSDDFSGVNNFSARLLAWQVFFQTHVTPYALQRRFENGVIE